MHTAAGRNSGVAGAHGGLGGRQRLLMPTVAGVQLWLERPALRLTFGIERRSGMSRLPTTARPYIAGASAAELAIAIARA